MLFLMLDIDIDDDGNMTDYEGDIGLSSSWKSMAKIIEWRLLTLREEWLYNPMIIANTPAFIGQVNNRANGERLRSNVQTALTADNLIPAQDLFVDVIPIAPDAVMIYIKIDPFNAPDMPEGVAEYKYHFDLSGKEALSLIGAVN